jgi:hypothetical protein
MQLDLIDSSIPHLLGGIAMVEAKVIMHWWCLGHDASQYWIREYEFVVETGSIPGWCMYFLYVFYSDTF